MTNPNCPCPSICSRKGDCAACRKHHAEHGGQPYCDKIRNASGSGLLKKIWRGVCYVAYLFCPT